MPSVLRIFAGLLGVVAGTVMAIVCVAITGAPDLAAMLIAAACLLAGYLGLGITRIAEAPLRPMRIALGLSILPTAYMLAGLPWPPGSADLGSLAVLGLGLLFSASAMTLGNRRRLTTVGMVAFLAAYGAFMLTRFGRHLVSVASDWDRPGPAITISYVLAASVGTAWIAALWHARWLWRSTGRQQDLAS